MTVEKKEANTDSIANNKIPSFSGAPVTAEEAVEILTDDLRLQKEEYESLLKVSDNIRARHDALAEENARYKQQLMNKNFQILNLVAKMFGNEQAK